MRFTKQLDEISSRVQAMPVSPQLREDVQSICVYLRNQALCDLDRRDRPQRIKEAVNALTEKLQQISLNVTFKLPRAFWLELDHVAGTTTNVPLRLVSESVAPVSGSEDWDALQLFKHLIQEVKCLPPDEEQFECLEALFALEEQAKLVRYRRDLKKINVDWLRAHPFVDSRGLMKPFKNHVVLKSRMRFFLKGHF